MEPLQNFSSPSPQRTLLHYATLFKSYDQKNDVIKESLKRNESSHDYEKFLHKCYAIRAGALSVLVNYFYKQISKLSEMRTQDYTMAFLHLS